jgi:hypothetical protein
MNATIRFACDQQADPLVHAFQATRLALAHREATALGLKVDVFSPQCIAVTGSEEPMARLLASLEKAQVFAALSLDVDAATEKGAEDYAEYLRDRSDNIVIVARQVESGPAC